MYSIILHAVRFYNNSDTDKNLFVIIPQFLRMLILVCLFRTYGVFKQYTLSGVINFHNPTVYISSTRDYLNHECCVNIVQLCNIVKISTITM